MNNYPNTWRWAQCSRIGCIGLRPALTLPHLHVNVGVYFSQILKIFAQIMANFSAFGMRPHPQHPYAVRLCLQNKLNVNQQKMLKYISKQ